MSTWADIAARSAPCIRCRSTFSLPGPLSPAGRERVVQALRDDRVIDVFRLIREDTGCGLAEAKGLYQHLVRRPGECHSCGGALPAGELIDCPRCRFLNITL